MRKCINSWCSLETKVSVLFAGKFACKILIQEVGLALANLLVVPGTIGILAIFDEYQTESVCFSQYFLPPYLFWNIDLTQDFISDKVFYNC